MRQSVQFLPDTGRKRDNIKKERERERERERESKQERNRRSVKDEI